MGQTVGQACLVIHITKYISHSKILRLIYLNLPWIRTTLYLLWRNILWNLLYIYIYIKSDS